MKAYKCDICGALFAKRLPPTLVNGLTVACIGFNRSADLCPECLEILRDTARKLSPMEENDEPETSCNN